MKKLIFILFFTLINLPTQAQDRVFKYLGRSTMGADHEITLKLKNNKEFFFSEIDDQECYIDKDVSLGKWEQKGQNIILKVSKKLQPKIKTKRTFLKKDTLTIFFRKMDDCNLLKKVLNTVCFYENKDENYYNYTYFRSMHFYDKNNKKIIVKGLQDSQKIEIPTSKKIAKIDFYFPNDSSPNSAKLSLKVSKKIGQIHISNLSRYLKSNFKGYTFILKKKHILLNGLYKLEQVK